MTAKRSENRAFTARRIIGDILAGAVILFTLYLCVIMIYRINTVVLKGSYIVIFAVELVFCACMMITALDIRSGFLAKAKKLPLKIAGWALRIIAFSVSALVVYLSGRVIAGGLTSGGTNARYAVVLGMALENGKPSEDLIFRLDTAEKYLAANHDAVLILTGGNADESGRTEAEVMREILAGRGVPDDRMILEDKAKTTKENFIGTAQLTGTDEPIAVISSCYHIVRACRYAYSAGFTDVTGYPAPAGALLYGADVMWEVVGLIFG